MKEKVIIYPITDRSLFLVDYLKDKYEIIPVEADGSGYSSKDLGYISGMCPIGVKPVYERSGHTAPTESS